MQIIKIPSNQGALEKKKGIELAPDIIVKKLKNYYLKESGLLPVLNIDKVVIDKNNLEETNNAIYKKVSSLEIPSILVGGDHSITYSAFRAFAEKYSNPGEDPPSNPFDAYYADAADGVYIVEGGNLPPAVGITLPEKGKIHFRGRPVLKTLFGNTILVGKTTISAYAEDDSGIEKVVFHIDGKIVKTDIQEPFEYTFRKISIISKSFRSISLFLIDSPNT